MDWDAYLGEICGNEVQRKNPMLERWELHIQYRPNALSRGHQMADRIRRNFALFDRDGRERSYDQMRMIDLLLCVNARNIYGSAFSSNMLEIMRYNHWTDLRKAAGVLAPRRFGKTWITSLGIAGMSVEIPGVKVCIYSPGARASGSQDGMLHTTKRFLVELFGIKKFDVDNNEHLFFTINGDQRQIRAFPGGRNAYVALFSPFNRDSSMHWQKKPQRPIDACNVACHFTL